MNPLYVVNPPKRRRRRKHAKRARAHNPGPRRHRRHSSRRRMNPGINFAGLNLQTIGLGVAGAVGAELGGAALLKFLPANMATNSAARIGVKAALVVVGAMLAKRFVGAGVAKALAVGGGIAVGVEAVREYVLPNVPGMGEYLLPAGAGASLAGYLNGGGHSATRTSDQFASQWG